MTATAVEKNLTEKKDKRAKSIAAMGLVNREGDKFLVSTPSLRGKQTSYQVWRDETGKIRCNCLEFEEAAVSDAGFRCEHILAVKYALVAKNTESATKQPITVETQVEVKPAQHVEEDKSATESHESTSGEQKADEAQENDFGQWTIRNINSFRAESSCEHKRRKSNDTGKFTRNEQLRDRRRIRIRRTRRIMF